MSALLGQLQRTLDGQIRNRDDRAMYLAVGGRPGIDRG
jgi:hypothetical protein